MFIKFQPYVKDLAENERQMGNDRTASISWRRALQIIGNRSVEGGHRGVTIPLAVGYGGLVAATAMSVFVLSPQDNHHLTIMAAIMLASTVTSIVGFAFSALCGAMLFHIDNSSVAMVQLMITCSIANQLTMNWMIRNDIIWTELPFYLAGGSLGLCLGVWLLLYADRHLYIHAFGVFLIAYGIYMLVGKPFHWRNPHRALDFGIGVLGGITGGAAAFPSASVTIWCGIKGWDKRRQRALVQPFILIMQFVTLVTLTLIPHIGVGNVAFDPNNLLFVPPSLLGTVLGMTLFQRLSNYQFTHVVNLLLIASGLSYLI